jgi:translation initiation factor 6
MLKKVDFSGNPYIGIYAFSNENSLVIPTTIAKKSRNMMKNVLGTDTVVTTIGDSIIVGALMCGNSNGLVFTNFVKESELKKFKGSNIYVIDSKLNAVGNTILTNDHGCLVHPRYDGKTIKDIENCLGVKVKRGSIAGIKTVGSVGVATNKGVICHPNASERDMANLKDVFGVEAAVGSANYGVGQVGACALANSRGALVGSSTTPIELGRFEEALRLY